MEARFLERQDTFRWHPGMLLDGATMQIAFPKDLVTFRNPASTFSFFSYLFDKGRLVDFVNHQTFFPTRHEFNDYLQWAAERVDADVHYGATVTRVGGVRGADGAVDEFEVETADGRTVRTRNLAVGAGLQEQIPDWATPSPRCFHNHQFLFRIKELAGTGAPALRGARRRPERRRGGAVPAPALPAGRGPQRVLPLRLQPGRRQPVREPDIRPVHRRRTARRQRQERERLLELHRSTNYSVVDIELINELYTTEYQELVRGQRRLFMRRASEISSVVDETRRHRGQCPQPPRRPHRHPDVRRGGAGDRLHADPAEQPDSATWPRPTAPSTEVERDYRLVTSPDVHGGIYLQGGTEKTHGLTASLLSNVAVRSGEILTSLLQNRTAGLDLDSVGVSTLVDHSKNEFATSEAR